MIQVRWGAVRPDNRLWWVYCRRKFPIYFEHSRVLEVGSRSVNGPIKDFFEDCDYVGVDPVPGPCVDIVGLAHEQTFEDKFDVVISASTLEYDRHWKKTLKKMAESVSDSGIIILDFACVYGQRDKESLYDTYNSIRAGEAIKILKDAGIIINEFRYLHTFAGYDTPLDLPYGEALIIGVKDPVSNERTVFEHMAPDDAMPLDATFAYVVACYLWSRSVSPDDVYNYDRLIYIRSHFEYLKSSDIPNLKKVVFVLNTDRPEQDVEAVLSVAKEYHIPYDVDYIVRKNINGSYGAWEDAAKKLVETDPDIDYAMFLEDDYVPVRDDFMRFFQDKFDGETGYVCQFWTNANVGKYHAGMSNGMLDLYKARSIMAVNEQRLFRLSGRTEHQHLVWNQVYFLEYLTKKYMVKDVSDYKQPFKDVGGVLTCWGGPGDPFIMPL
ncbi:Uncharacterised protein [uncultured archaeon]|nr:Uncharacterised protein [uncultured archaeon]